MIPEKELKSMFEGVSKLYDFFNDLFSFMLVRLWRRTVSRRFLKKTNRVLDLGIGTGYLSKNIKEDRRVLTVGLDITKTMVLKNIGKLQLYSDPVIGTAANMPFRDDAFETLVSSFTLRSFKKVGMDKVISECKRVVRDKGDIIMLDTAKPNDSLALSFFSVYFKIINFIGGIYNDPAYHWLTKSIMDLDLGYVTEKLREHFNNIMVYKLTGGVAYIWLSKNYKSQEY
ncbi:MAG: class I SAM-dependent methyltransferase [Nitrososphaeria archaeon]|nr:class I SAM-dependent methyltransferase [Conexivisphaerales archaeon]